MRSSVTRKVCRIYLKQKQRFQKCDVYRMRRQTKLTRSLKWITFRYCIECWLMFVCWLLKFAVWKYKISMRLKLVKLFNQKPLYQVTSLEAFAMATIDSGSETSQTMRATFESRPSMPVASEVAFRTAFSLDSLRPRIKKGRRQGQFLRAKKFMFTIKPRLY